MAQTYEIKNRYTGEVLFSYELQEGQESGMIARHAAEAALAAEANLRGADLYGADLYGADLYGADLYGADLRGANLYEANLCEANLRGADLYGADLYGADLRGANLREANLCEANLRGADLYGADLYGADLRGANLRGANLCEADLRGAIGDMKFVKSLQIDTWRIVYTHEHLIIGCQKHLISEWKDWKNKPAWIDGMASNATTWAVKHLDLILQVIEVSPAEAPVIAEKAE